MTRPAAGVLLLAALLAVPLAHAAVEPNPRASPDLTLAGPVTAMARATSSGHIVAGMADPGDSFGEPADAEVWRLWDSTGDEVASGRADAATCSGTTIVPALGDRCVGHVVAVAVSAAGTRIAIAARGETATSGRLLFLAQSGGATTTVANLEFSGEAPTDLAMNAEGSQVAVGLDRGGAGRARAYDWTGTGSGVVTQMWATDTPTAITELALGNDRTVVAAGGAQHYRFASAGALTADTSPSEKSGTVLDVAIGRVSSDHWSAAVTSAGEFLLYDDATPTQPRVVAAGTSPKRVVAMSNDGVLAAAGDDAGVVWLYLNIHLQDDPTRGYRIGASAPLGAAVTSLQFSLDGAYLVAGTAQGTSLLRTTTTALATYWTHATGNVVQVASDGAGNTLASAAGPEVTVFTPLHAVTIAVAGNGTLRPGGFDVADVTYTNTGNREARVVFENPGLPTGWTGSLSDLDATLAPGESATAVLNVSAPANAAAGTANVQLTRRINGGLPQTSAIGFGVEQVQQWVLAATGPVSAKVDAGQSVTFPFKATNLGNGAATTDVLVSASRTGWSATVTPTTLNAARNGVAYGNVTLTAPEGAVDLDSAAATLTLSADDDARLRLTGTVGARFAFTLDAAPRELAVAPGTSHQVTLTIRNDGNAPDTYKLQAAEVPAGWASSVAAPVTAVVQPGASVDVVASVVPVVDAAPGGHELVYRVTSQAAPDQSKTATVLLQVEGDESPSPTKSGSKGSPAPGLGLAILALAGLAVALRRRD